MEVRALAGHTHFTAFMLSSVQPVACIHVQFILCKQLVCEQLALSKLKHCMTDCVGLMTLATPLDDQGLIHCHCVGQRRLPLIVPSSPCAYYWQQQWDVQVLLLLSNICKSWQVTPPTAMPVSVGR